MNQQQIMNNFKKTTFVQNRRLMRSYLLNKFESYLDRNESPSSYPFDDFLLKRGSTESWLANEFRDLGIQVEETHYSIKNGLIAVRTFIGLIKKTSIG